MQSTHKDYNFECENSTCDYPHISAFEYAVTLKSEGYKDLNFNWEVTKNTAIKNIVFENDYQLIKTNLLSQKDAEKILNNTTQKSIEETIEEKIEKLKTQQQTHLIITWANNINYIFKNINNKLHLFQDDISLWIFDFYEKSNISLYEIVWNPNYLSLYLWNKKYIFSKKLWILYEYILDIPIIYIKSTSTNGQFIFVTEKWSFEYNLYKNDFKYNSLFSDFIFFDKKSFIWIINKDDKEKKERFSYKNINKTLIIQYFPDTKQHNILLELDEDVEKIFKESWIVYIENNKNVFQISQLQE